MIHDMYGGYVKDSLLRTNDSGLRTFTQVMDDGSTRGSFSYKDRRDPNQKAYRTPWMPIAHKIFTEKCTQHKDKTGVEDCPPMIIKVRETTLGNNKYNLGSRQRQYYVTQDFYDEPRLIGKIMYTYEPKSWFMKWNETPEAFFNRMYSKRDGKRRHLPPIPDIYQGKIESKIKTATRGKGVKAGKGKVTIDDDVPITQPPPKKGRVKRTTLKEMGEIKKEKQLAARPGLGFLEKQGEDVFREVPFIERAITGSPRSTGTLTTGKPKTPRTEPVRKTRDQDLDEGIETPSSAPSRLQGVATPATSRTSGRTSGRTSVSSRTPGSAASTRSGTSTRSASTRTSARSNSTRTSRTSRTSRGKTPGEELTEVEQLEQGNTLVVNIDGEPYNTGIFTDEADNEILDQLLRQEYPGDPEILGTILNMAKTIKGWDYSDMFGEIDGHLRIDPEGGNLDGNAMIEIIDGLKEPNQSVVDFLSNLNVSTQDFEGIGFDQGSENEEIERGEEVEEETEGSEGSEDENARYTGQAGQDLLERYLANLNR